MSPDAEAVIRSWVATPASERETHLALSRGLGLSDSTVRGYTQRFARELATGERAPVKVTSNGDGS